MSLHVIILAAGKGTRMQSNIPKVLHKLGGKALLEHVINTAQKLNPAQIHVVYGDGGDLVKQTLSHYDKLNWVRQDVQLGTAHAVSLVLPCINTGMDSRVLILYGDVPLIKELTLVQLVEGMPSNGLNLLTANFCNPHGLGRIIRDDFGNVKEIVEHKDASEAQLQVTEINTGIMTTTLENLQKYLPKINKNNAQGEYYLTDLISMLVNNKLSVSNLLVEDQIEVAGINDKQQLSSLERFYQWGLVGNLMKQGLMLMDSARFDLRGELTFGDDVIVDINVIVEGKVEIGSQTSIGPNNILKNVQIGKNVVIKANCVIEDAVIGDNCVIGPFARIRPGTTLANSSHVGNFVELKNTYLGENSKANHLTYLGDTVVGDKVNIGAGTITCNYDGVKKYKTVIEKGAFIGSNTSLVAPVTIGSNAVIGAGSVINMDAPAEKLTLGRSRQLTIDNWKRK